MARKSRSKQRGKGVGSRSQSAGKSKGGSRSSAGSKGGSKSGGNKSGSGKKSSSKKSSTKKKSSVSSSPSGNKRGSGQAGQGTAGGGQTTNPTKKAETKGISTTTTTTTSTPDTKSPIGGRSGAGTGGGQETNPTKDLKIGKVSTDIQDALSRAFEALVAKKDPAPAPTPTVSGSLPSDYKETEEKAFKEAENFKKQQKANQAREAGELSNLPADYKETEAEVFESANNFKKQQEANQPKKEVANLPTDYKETEKKAFQDAEAYKAKVAADRKAASDLQIAGADAEAQYDIDRAAEDEARREEQAATYATNRQKLIDQREARRLAEAEARETARLAKAAEDKAAAEAKAAADKKAAEDKRIADEKAAAEAIKKKEIEAAKKAEAAEAQRQLEFNPEGRLNEDMLIAGDYTSPNVTNYGLRPDGSTGFYKEGDVFNTGGISGKDYKFDGKEFVPVLKKAAGDVFNAITGTAPALAQEQPRDFTELGLQETFSTKGLFTPKTDEPSISSSLGTGLNIGGTDTETEAAGSTSRALDPTEPGISIQEKARRRDAIFQETGVQTFGGTRDVYGYTKSELDKLKSYADESGLSFGSVIGQQGTQYPGQLGVSQEEIDLYNAYQYEDGLVMNSIGQLVTPEQRAIDDADAGDSIGRSIATGFNNLVDKIPIIGDKLPDLKTDYTRAQQDLLSNTTPFRTGAKDKRGNITSQGGAETYTPLPDETVEEEVIADTPPTPSDQLQDIIDSQTDPNAPFVGPQQPGDDLVLINPGGGSDELVDLINPGGDLVGPQQPGEDLEKIDDDLPKYTPFDPDNPADAITGTDTETGTGTTATATEDAIQEAINRLFDPNYMAKFQFGKRGMRRGSFRKAFNRKYF